VILNKTKKMYNKNIKLFIALLILAYAVYQFIEGYIGNGIMYILLSSIFILSLTLKMSLFYCLF